MDKGIYTLILQASGGDIMVGALGKITIPGGFLIYVGSALGPGGLSRVERHIRAAHDGRTPHWHIDYLLQEESIRIIATISAITDEPLECRLADEISGPFVHKFGSSDCRCQSHLFIRSEDPTRLSRDAYASLGLAPLITRY
ncbi:GIY-YIG nuclease family protein [Methanocalculus sp. MSAO_Arc2]|uniref:GIY-YIG nuclease family protein n=1 Tax=Methanocalculus sp. MSAO_Arc2 TaxID=2293855 RepID=UPI0026938E53